MTGTNKKISLWNRDGIRLGDIGEMNDWVWTSAVHSNQEKKMIFGGSNKGHIAMFDLEFLTVHGLYEDRYAC